jgi:predicted membrane-bound dolichyl-phosphate-mannose-protein mannosyltransferase
VLFKHRITDEQKVILQKLLVVIVTIIIQAFVIGIAAPGLISSDSNALVIFGLALLLADFAFLAAVVLYLSHNNRTTNT